MLTSPWQVDKPTSENKKHTEPFNAIFNTYKINQ
jgi:hypothetical protein